MFRTRHSVVEMLSQLTIIGTLWKGVREIGRVFSSSASLAFRWVGLRKVNEWGYYYLLDPGSSFRVRAGEKRFGTGLVGCTGTIPIQEEGMDEWIPGQGSLEGRVLGGDGRLLFGGMGFLLFSGHRVPSTRRFLGDGFLPGG